MLCPYSRKARIRMKSKRTSARFKRVEEAFGFLFDHGFQVRLEEDAPDFFGNWVVEFESAGSIIYLTKDRGSIILEFSSSRDHDPKKRVNLQKIVYVTSGGRTIISAPAGHVKWSDKQALRALAGQLQEHLAEVESYFRPRDNC